MYFSPRCMLHIIYATLLVLALNPNAHAQLREFTEQVIDSEDSIGTEFYTIADPEEENPELITPLSIFKTLNALENDLFAATDPNSAAEQNLLKWVFHEIPNAEIPEKYQRKNHFGTWIRDPSRNTCLNVRGLVLQRDALDEVTYADEKHCRITASRWLDPYTNTEWRDAADIQIDHMVPLKNAYISGAWQWNRAQRCNYSNFMGNDFHLLAVLGSENSKKSDHTPNRYIPPRAEAVCHYLVNWLKIKSIWRLKLSKDEALAIEKELKNYNCTADDFQLDWNELREQRNKSFEYPASCNRTNSDRINSNKFVSK